MSDTVKPPADVEECLYEEPRSIQQILRSMRSNVNFPTYLATALTGWLTDGIFISHMNAGEIEWVEGFAKRQVGVEDGKAIDAYNLLNTQRNVGPVLKFRECLPAVKDYPYRQSLVKLASKFNDVLFMPTWMYATLRHRHPKSSFHMTGWTPAAIHSPVVVMTKSIIYGMVMPYNVVK